MFFDEGSDDFFVGLDGAREADRLTSQALNAGAERQVITLNALGEYVVSATPVTSHFCADPKTLNIGSTLHLTP